MSGDLTGDKFVAFVKNHSSPVFVGTIHKIAEGDGGAVLHDVHHVLANNIVEFLQGGRDGVEIHSIGTTSVPNSYCAIAMPDGWKPWR